MIRDKYQLGFANSRHAHKAIGSFNDAMGIRQRQ